MLEGIAASILSRYLGKYIDGLQKENLNVSIGEGDLVLENLKLKSEALDDLELPIQVCGGTLGTLRLKIPWKKLKSEPAVISLEDLFILVSPRSTSDSNQEAQRNRELKIKKRNLQLAELMGSKSSSTDAPTEDNSGGYFSSYTSLIVNNLQIYIDRVHIRYEDATSNSTNPFVMGITLEQIHAETTNENWESSFMSSNVSQIVHKLVSLKNLAVYWDSGIYPSTFANDEQMSKKMSSLIHTDSNPQEHSYVLHPINAALKVVMNRDPIPDMEIPKMTLNFVFDEIALSLSTSQYRDLLDTVEYFQRCNKFGKYNHHRPSVAISKDPMAYWRFMYIVKCKQEEVSKLRNRWKWSEMKKMKEIRLKYIELYCKKKRNKKNTLQSPELEKFEEIENDLEYETILLFRSLADKYLEKDKAYAEIKKQELAAQSSQSWFGSMWNYIPGAGSVDLSLQLTDDIMKEIYQEMHDQEDKPFQVQDIPKDYVKMRINFKLTTGSIELRDKNSDDSRIARATFNGYHISLEKRKDSISFSGDLMSMEVTDYHTKNTKFPHLISQSLTDDDDDTDPYFFTMMVDVNPLDSIADYRLLLSMKPLNIVLSKSFLNRVVNFFSKPITQIRRRKMEELNVRAYTRLKEIRQQTEDQLIQAMADRKIFDVQVHLSAPNLMIPKNFEDEHTSTLILVLGTLSISSDLRGKRKKKTNQNEMLELSDTSDEEVFYDCETMEGFEELVSTSNEYKQDESKAGKDFSYLYDKFYLSLTSLEAGITTRKMGVDNIQATPDENLIEKFDVNLYLEVCNIDSFELPKIIISGTLPSLRLNVSPEKTTTIMQILNTLNKNSTESISVPLQEAEVIDDLEDSTTNEKESKETPQREQTEESSESEVPASKKAQKRQILLKFSIPEATLLFSENQEPIALIWLNGISVSYLKRPFDVEVSLTLHGLTIEDKYQRWGDEFNYLATSETLSLEQSTNEITDLIQVTYEGITKEAPHYQKVNHSVTFLFHKVHVTLNRETIIKLVGCMKSIQSALKNGSNPVEPEPEAVKEENENENLANDVELQDPVASDIVLFAVSAQVNDISFTMNDAGIKIGIIQLRKSNFGFNLKRNTVKVDGSFGTMRIHDLDPGTYRYPQMFDSQSDEDMVSFTYQTFRESEPDFPGYGVLLNITINSVRYMWIERFQLRVRQYFSEIPEMQKILSNTASSAAAVIKQKRLFRYQIKLHNPYIIIPQHVDTDRCLIVDLGEIIIDKQFPVNDDGVHLTRIFVDVKAMNWKTGILGSGEYLAILDNTDLQLWWEKPSDEAVLNQHIVPNMNVWVYFPLLHLTLSEYQCWQICDTIVQNICAEPTAHEKLVQSIKEKLYGPKNNVSDVKENESDEDFEFQPDEEKWTDMFIDFHVDKWVIETLRNSGIDEEGNSTRVGDLEVLDYDMKYTLYSNGAHVGIFGMRSMKIKDRRFANPNQFKEILTPLGPGVGKLGVDDYKPPNIVGAWADKRNQWECRYERSPDGFQDMSYSWDHCYFIAVPDAIFEIFDVVKPVIFDDITPTAEVWRNWKNPNPVNVVPLSKQSTKMQMKMAITSSEVFLLEDPSNINTQSIVVRSTFSIIFKRDSRVNSRTWVVMVDQMECFKCRLAIEDSAVSIMQPLNWCVDFYADDTKSNIRFDLAPMVFYFSYKDYLTSKRIIDNWLPWLSGREGRKRQKPVDDRPVPIILESFDKLPEALKNQTTRPQLLKEESKQESSESDQSFSEEDEEDDEDLDNDDSEHYLSQLDPIIKAKLSGENIRATARDSLLNEDSSEEDDRKNIVLKDIQEEIEQKSEPRLPVVEPMTIEDPTIEQILEVTTGGLKFILIDDSQHNHNNPLATIVMENFSVELSSWSVNMKVRLVSEVRVDYYHTKLEVWEPVIEPWFFQFVISRSPAPAQLSKYQIYASKKCEINITAAMIETTLNTIEALSNLDYSKSVELPPLLHPYIIRNETGLALSYWLSNEEEYVLCDLGIGEERSLQDVSSGHAHRKRHNDEVVLPPSVSLIVSGEYTPVKNIPIEKVGTYITRVSPVDRNAWLACEVSFRTGSKVLIVKSNIQISNHTLVPLEAIALVEYKDSITLDPIPPGQIASVPLAFASTGIMQFRPDENFRWNEGELLLYKIHRLKRNRVVMCKQLHRGSTAPNFFYQINLSTSHSGKIHHINVHPPLCLENLLPVIMEYRIIHKHTKQTLYNRSVLKGESQFIHNVDPNLPLTISVKIPCFGWSKSEDINSNIPSEVLHLLDEQQRTLSLRVINLVESNGMRKISVFAQYWMLNHTGLRLLYRRSGFDSSLAAGQGQMEKKEIELGNHPRDWYNDDGEYDEPFLFTTPFYNLDPRGDLARIKIATSEWSQNFNLNSQGTTSVLDIPDQHQEGRITRCFSISMTVSAGHDIFWRTKVVSLYPRFIIINNLDQEFVYHQKGSITHLCSIHPGENIPFHWADKDAPRQICIRLNDKGWEWSGGFEIEELSGFSLKMRNSLDPTMFYLARVRVKMDNASTLIIISPENMEFPGYRIENMTNKTMRISQVYSSNFDIIEPKSQVPYAWDKPMAPHTLEINFEGHNEQLEVSLDYLKSYVPIRVGRDRMRVIVCAKGPTKVLAVESTNIQDELPSEWTEMNNDNPIDSEAPEVLQSELQMAIQGIGISVIDETPLELSYITVEKIHLVYSTSNLFQNIEFSIGWLQIDNQLYQTPYPLVVYPVAPEGNESANIFFDLNLRISTQVSSITYIKSFCAMLQKIDLKLDEEFVLHTMKFVSYLTNFMKKRKLQQSKKDEEVEDHQESQVHDESLESALRAPEDVEEMLEKDIQSKFVNYTPDKVSTLQSKFIYFEILHIYPVQVNFSFANVPGAERDQDTMISRILSRGGILANIDSAPLVLGELILEHPFSTRSETVDRITKHYINSAIREFHKMLGSADFLGSPISFVRTMGTGFYDFFNEPRQNLDSPYAFSLGVARGTQSLLKNSTWGAFNSAAKFSSTLGKGAAALTFDKPYVRERELLSREKPLHVFQGVAFGLRDFGLGCFQGVGGVVYEPLRGAYDDRLPGMVKGVGRGVIGLGLKPVIGAVDFITRTAEGIRNTATYWDEIRRGRIRPPRYFGRDKVLETFSEDKACGQEILFTTERGKYRREFYMHHIEEETTIILISDVHIVSVSRFDTKQEDWHVKISEICGLETDNRGVLLHLSAYIASSAFESPTHKRVIFCRAKKRQQVYNVLLYWLQILKHPSIC